MKLWSADGKVLYADESQLIGRSFDAQQGPARSPRPARDRRRRVRPGRVGERVRERRPARRGLPPGLDAQRPGAALRDVRLVRPGRCPHEPALAGLRRGHREQPGALRGHRRRPSSGTSCVASVGPRSSGSPCSSGPSTRRPTSAAGSPPACTTGRCRSSPPPRSPSPGASATAGAHGQRALARDLDAAAAGRALEHPLAAHPARRHLPARAWPARASSPPCTTSPRPPAATTSSCTSTAPTRTTSR